MAAYILEFMGIYCGSRGVKYHCAASYKIGIRVGIRFSNWGLGFRV